MKTKIIAAVLGVLIALGMIGGAVAWAQGGTQTQGSAPQKGQRCEEHQTALAQKLGISLDKLQQAQIAVANDRIDQAVKQGKLTTEQATKLKQRVTESKGCAHSGNFDRKGKQPGPQAMRAGLKVALDAAAKALNMTSDQLMQELRSGKKLADIAKAKNVDLKTVRDAVIAAEKAALDQAVKDGKLTQEQANKMKEMLDKNADKILDRFQQGGPNGPRPQGPKKTR